MTTRPPHTVPQPEVSVRRNRTVLGLVVAALVLHVLVCEWKTKTPDRSISEIARLPNPARYVVGEGSPTLILCVEGRLGRLLGVILGLVLPVVMIAAAGLIRLDAREFKQIAGAGLCVLLGFGLLIFLTWALRYW